MGKPLLAYATLPALRNEELNLKKERKRDLKTCFSNINSDKGQIMEKFKTEVKKERVKKWVLSFFKRWSTTGNSVQPKVRVKSNRILALCASLSST